MRWVSPAIVLMVLVAALAGGAAAASASNQVVVGCSASALVSAFDTANKTPGVDTLSLAPACIYTLTRVDNHHNGLPMVVGEVTIVGNGATITRAPWAPGFRILTVVAGGSLTLRNVTISNGLADVDCPEAPVAVCAGGIANSGTLVLDSSTITRNTVRAVFPQNCSENSAACTAGAGGIESKGTLTLTNSQVSNNVVEATGPAANGLGGGVLTFADLTLRNSGVVGNRVHVSGAGAGGGVAGGGAGNVQEQGPLTVENSQIEDNSVTGDGRFGGGGAIYVFRADSVRVTGSVVTDNSATGGDEAHGGGVVIRRTPTFIHETVVQRNTATSTHAGGGALGGGIDVIGKGASLELTSSQVLDNTAVGDAFAQTGGVGAAGSILDTTIQGNIVRANGGDGTVGGGLSVYGPLTLANSTVSDNESTTPNGDAWSAGIHLFRGIGILHATNATITDNIATGEAAAGAGIYVRPGTSLTLDSSVVQGNSANGTTTARGGGIANQSGNAELDNTSVTLNSATGPDAAGGGLFNDGGIFLLTSSPITNNTPDNCFPLGSISGCTG